MSAPQRTRPVQRFAEAVAKCRVESTAYGQCIFADYQNIYKDKCAAEFAKLKDCYLMQAKKK